MRRRQEAENALFAPKNQDDLEAQRERTKSKQKKKKQQKDWVRREVNYMLDYNSPYAEYLVARFREYSPQVKGPSRALQHRPGNDVHYKELQDVYMQGGGSRQQSRHGVSSQSPDRQQNHQTAAKKQSDGGRKKQSSQLEVNPLFVEDIDEV